MNTRGLTTGLIVFLFVGASAVIATATLQEHGDVAGRTFHADLYEDEKCSSCHGTTEPSGFPADDVCLDCHDLEGVVAATERSAADEVWQNPHNNMHWGKDVPCMECHGEHAARTPLCQGCHAFKYDAFQD